MTTMNDRLQLSGHEYAEVTSATPIYDLQQQTAKPAEPAPRVIVPQRDLTVATEVAMIDTLQVAE